MARFIATWHRVDLSLLTDHWSTSRSDTQAPSEVRALMHHGKFYNIWGMDEIIDINP